MTSKKWKLRAFWLTPLLSAIVGGLIIFIGLSLFYVFGSFLKGNLPTSLSNFDDLIVTTGFVMITSLFFAYPSMLFIAWPLLFFFEKLRIFNFFIYGLAGFIAGAVVGMIFGIVGAGFGAYFGLINGLCGAHLVKKFRPTAVSILSSP